MLTSNKWKSRITGRPLLDLLCSTAAGLKKMSVIIKWLVTHSDSTVIVCSPQSTQHLFGRRFNLIIMMVNGVFVAEEKLPITVFSLAITKNDKWSIHFMVNTCSTTTQDCSSGICPMGLLYMLHYRVVPMECFWIIFRFSMSPYEEITHYWCWVRIALIGKDQEAVLVDTSVLN